MHQKEFISNGYIMVVLVVEFSSGGYKIGKIIAQKSTYLKEIIRTQTITNPDSLLGKK